MSQNEVISILKAFISLLKNEGIAIQKAYLFGSYLTNSATDDSDIDVLIVTENEENDLLIGKIWSLTKKVNAQIEPYLIGAKRFYGDDSSPLINSIKLNGLEI